MNRSLALLSDSTLRCGLVAKAGEERIATAELLPYLAEFDARKLYVRESFSSMHEFCVAELGMSSEAAFKRIHAARAGRQFPAIFAAVKEGRLHLSAVVMLAPRLTEANAAKLIAAASRKTKSQIEQLLAERFPVADVPTRIESVSSQPALRPRDQRAPGRVDDDLLLPPKPFRENRPTVKPLAPERFALQVTIDQSTRDKLRRAQELLSHAIPSGDVAQVLDRALDLLVSQLERRKFAATSKQRPSAARPTSSERHVPAGVRRAVWERDRGQCTFVSTTGRRCESRTRLEFDHMEPVARGGRATVANVRLRCRAHNQFEAERVFGTEFMRRKRQRASEARAAATIAPTPAPSPPPADTSDVIPWLRKLGFRADEARLAAARCASIPNEPLEQRVRVALSFLGASAAQHHRGFSATA